MRLHQMLITCAVVIGHASSAAAQKLSGPAPMPGPDVRASIAAWRSGLEVSVNGSAWSQSASVALTRAQCPPSDTSPCASGSAVGVDVRFPAVAQATELAKARAALGETGGQSGARYEVRVVRSQSSPLCPGGFAAASPETTSRLAINLGPPGPPLPLTCKWAAVVGVPDASRPSKVMAVWSDTVSVVLTSKR